MVNIEEAGTMITIILIVAGSFMAAIALQETDSNGNVTESFGLRTDLNKLDANQSSIVKMIDSFNSDVNNISKSTLDNQVRFGGSAVLTGAQIIAAILFGSLTNWIVMVDMLFKPFSYPVTLLANPIKLIFGFIMVFTIIKFLGGIIRSLPFFGSAA